jgi:hypothetical protein
VAEAIVRHDVVRPPLRELFWRAWVAGAFPRLAREIPELRRTPIARGFVLGRPDARMLAYGLALLAFRSLRPFGVAAGTGWIVSRARRARADRRSIKDIAVTLPILLALDLTRSIALVIGSIRARTPIL